MFHYFANPSPEVTPSEKAHSDYVRKIAGECMVLLENDGSLKIGYLQRCCVKLLEVDLMCGGFETAGSYNAGRNLKDFTTAE